MIRTLMNPRGTLLPAGVRSAVALLLIAGSIESWAQEAAPAVSTGSPAGPAQDAAGQVQDVIVTGSRIARSGFDTPTPVTVIGAEAIQQSGQPNIAGFVNELPAVSGSTTPANSNRSLSSGTAGVNSVNLRSLGNSRTLVLLDGHRSVASTVDGVVDVNTFPQALVKSVEIVTGGAAATYGSDAVSGVVNFILDKDFTGVKADVHGGETTYDDDRNITATLTAGMPFAGGRGHVLLNGETSRVDGVYGMGGRSFATDGVFTVNNPAYVPGNGAPEYFVTAGAGQSVLAPGGIIVSSTVRTPTGTATSPVLRGAYFGIGGTVNQLAYGATTFSNPWMIGGDYQVGLSNSRTSLEPQDSRDGLFGRLAYDFTDSLSGYVQASWNQDRAQQWGGEQTDKGNIPIKADNAFIPLPIQQQIQAYNTTHPGGEITQLTLGSSEADIPTRTSNNYRVVQRYEAGLSGAFTLGTEFKWDAHYQEGISRTHELLYGTNNARLSAATDAVVDPSTGGIVCRSTLTAPDNGCVPFNRMGIGVNPQAAVDYIEGYPQRDERLQENVGALNLRTQLANPLGSPIGLAFGYEHRKESISGFVDPQYNNGWIVGNFLPTFGSYTVDEGYLEALVPLPFGLRFDGAVRATDYSTSGYVTSWKLGLSFMPIDEVRLRATVSRDIRAPNLQELFQAGQRNTNYVTDPFYDNTATRYTQTVTGNSALVPESADTHELGIVFTPSFLTGFALSADYYDIKISDAIRSLGPQDIVDRCFLGIQRFCDALTRDPASTSGHDLFIQNEPFNFVSQRARGIDLESSYKFQLSSLMSSLSGSLSLRALATHYLELLSDNGLNAPTDAAGQNTGGGPPHWLYRLTAQYNLERLTLSLTGRGISAGVYDNTYVECTSGCPLSTTYNRTINDNHIAGAIYFDGYMSYDLGLGSRTEGQVYLTIRNIANRAPAPVGNGPSDSSNVEPGINRSLYDFLGRTFTLGFQVKWGP